MSAIEDFMSPVSAEAACGANKLGTADYKAVRRRMEQNFPGDDKYNTSYKKFDADVWDRLVEDCEALFSNNDDGFRGIELGMMYSLAKLKGSRGLEGWAESLKLIQAWIDNDLIWSGILPLPIVERMRLFKQFGSGAATREPFVFVRTLDQIPLKNINGAAVEACSEAFERLCSSLAKRLDPGDGASANVIAALRATLIGSKDGEAGALTRLGRLLGKSPTDKGTVVSPVDGARIGQGLGGVAEKQYAGPPLVRSQDVKALLELVIQFYAHQQPSSPVGVLVRRARLLVDASLEQVIEEMLGSSARSQLEKVGGKALQPAGQPVGSSDNKTEITGEMLIKVIIHLPDGLQRMISVPGSFTPLRLINELIGVWNLPTTGLGGIRRAWQLDTADASLRLAPDQTLAAGGVKEGHRLLLMFVEPSLSLTTAEEALGALAAVGAYYSAH